VEKLPPVKPEIIRNQGKNAKTLVANNSGKSYGEKSEKKVPELRNHASS
jgi:hypothetical protein